MEIQYKYMKTKKRKLSHLRGIVIVHGKSELQIVKHIKSNLRITIEIFAEKNGENSIQINGLKNILGNTIFKSIGTIQKNYPTIQVSKNGKNKVLENFKIFIIMDTDDCTQKEKENFINKEMFKNHWAYEYIVPIYNSDNLEDVLKSSNVKYNEYDIKNIKDKDLKSKYIKIFPIKNGATQDEIEKLKELNETLRKSKKTNINEFIDYCMDISN